LPPSRTAGAPQTWPYRYELLDGLRGLAALVVVTTHLGLDRLGHYAVMPFFVISGYCVAAAAESCRQKGLTVRGFMWRRFRRIYPPYFLSIVFYTLTRVAKLGIVGRNSLTRPWTDWLQNLTLTQWVSLLHHPLTDTADNHKLFVGAYWSLAYEEQFYLVVALALLLSMRRRMPMLASILPLTAIGLAWNVMFPSTMRGFFIEYWVHFSLGALLFYVLCIIAKSTVRVTFVVAVGALFLYSLSQILPQQLEFAPRVWLDLAVASGFTLALFSGRPLSYRIANHPLWRPISALGVITYSLYLVHQFNLTLSKTVANWIAPHAPDVVRVVITIAVLVLIGALFWYCCERPFLNRPLTPQKVPPADQPVGTPLEAQP
jgi:peptidoglycan/LPS O-acetylase OafA/YrhL